MGALAAQLGSFVASQLSGSQSKSTFIVKTLRGTYLVNGTLIAVIWYSAWRNERVAPGEGKFPFPGIKDMRRKYKADRPEKELDRPKKTAGAGAAATIGVQGEKNINPIEHGTGNGLALQRQHPELKPGVAKVVETIMHKFPGLIISSTTGGVHVSDSRHYEGRAVDLAGSVHEMKLAAVWISQNLYTLLDEGIHNPGLSVAEGKHVSSSYYSAVWAEHANHIHVAV